MVGHLVYASPRSFPGIRVERCNVPAVSRGTVRNTDKDGLFHVEHQQVAPVWDCFTWNRERLI